MNKDWVGGVVQGTLKAHVLAQMEQKFTKSTGRIKGWHQRVESHGFQTKELEFSTKSHFYLQGVICLFFYFSGLFLNFIYLWLHVSSLFCASFLQLWCTGFSLQWLVLLQSAGSRHAGSAVVVHGLSCPSACGIFLDQGSNLCPLHWQADSSPLDQQGSPGVICLKLCFRMKSVSDS